MLRTALRSLRAHALRFALAGFAVVLGVAFVVGALLYGESARAGAARADAGSLPDVSAVVTDRGVSEDGPARLDGRVTDRLAKLPGVARVRGVVEGSAFVVGRDGKLVGSLADSAGVNYQPGEGGRDARYPLAAGRGPRDAGEVALDRTTAQRAGYRPGDELRVIVRGETRKVRLTGTFTAHDSRLARGGALTAFDGRTALRDLPQERGRGWSELALTAEPGVTDEELARRAEGALPEEMMALTRDEALYSPGTDEEKMGDMLLSFAAVVLLVSVFLVGNTFTMLSNAAAREHALLRVVGATRGYVKRLVLTQAVLIGVVASAVGYVAGAGVGALLGRVFPLQSDLPGAAAPAVPLLSPTAAVAALAVGVGITAVAAWLPARRAARVAPVSALSSGESAAPKSLRGRTVAGFLVTGVGALAALGAMTSDSPEAVVLAGAVLLVGLTLLAPWCAVALAGPLRGPLRRFAGVRGTLAVENARRNPRRTAATASALMTGLMLISAATVGLTSMSAKAEQDVAAQATSDLRVGPVDFAELGTDTASRISRLPDAAKVRVDGEPGEPPRAVLVDAAPGRTDALRAEITRTLDNPTVVVQDRAELAAAAARPYEPFLNLVYALLSVSVLIGVLGVVNTMAMSVRERVRETGLLRAIGLDRSGTASMVRLEAVLISLLGAVLGITAGTALGAVAVLGQDAALHIPWPRLALFLAAALLLGTLAAALPARQAARVPVLRAVGDGG